MRLLLAVLLASSAVAQTPPVLDRAGLDPVLSRSWTAGEGCGADLMDFVIDTDGQPYIRNNGFTPLSGFTLQGSVLTTTDDVGIGRTSSVYHLGDDGSLRLWSEIYDPAFGEEGQRLLCDVLKLCLGDEVTGQRLLSADGLVVLSLLCFGGGSDDRPLQFLVLAHPIGEVVSRVRALTL